MTPSLVGAIAASGPWMPEAASAGADEFDAVFLLIFYVSAFFFVLVVGAMTWFVVKFRRRSPDQQVSRSKGNRTIEILWAVIPSGILLVFFLLGFRGYLGMAVPPAHALEVRVIAAQWTWSFDYPKEGINASELVVPVGRPVRLTMSSKDVIHSFFIPAFRIKRDVLPNRYTVTWFSATKRGTYDVLCAEYCGTSHSGMLSHVKVVSDTEYRQWLDSGGGMSGKGLSSVDFGKMLFSAKGCATCHSLDGSKKTGPSLAGKYGTTETLKDGSRVQVDDNYVRESLMQPNAKVVQGYEAVMPTFQGRLKDEQVNALIDYLKSLGP